MLFESAIFWILFAGFINASFVIPARYLKSFSNTYTWFYHSILGLIILPWLILYILFPWKFQYYLLLPPNILLFLLFCGLLFGLGQLCFAYAIESIGIALSFAINLGIGVTLGSLFVVIHNQEFMTKLSIAALLAVLLILFSLLCYYKAGKDNKILNKNHYRSGWLLATFAGVTSGLQNVAFVLVASHKNTLLPSNNLFWVWPPFLAMAGFMMALGFWIKSPKKGLYSFIINDSIVKKILGILIMGLCFTGSLALYSIGMSRLTIHEEVLGWPAFMVAIILTSQMWGFAYKEHARSNRIQNAYRIVSIIFLIAAIILLSINSN